MSKKLNFAVIGCGMLARSMHIPNIAASDKTILHSCCDLSDEALAECRDIHGALHITKDFKEAINNPEVDAICLATTEKMRLPVIEAAAKAGKPIYCEKPVAQSLDTLYKIQKIIQDSGIAFCVGHNRRSSPAMLDAHRIFRGHMTNPQPCLWRFDREGEIRPEIDGDGKAAISIRINDDWFSWKAWAFTKEHAPHGAMLFEMTHFTDLANWFLDSKPIEVTAMEQGLLSSSIIVRYETGEMANILMCGNGTFGYPKELYEVMGNGAMVAVDHMLEVRTAGITDAPARTTYAMLLDRHPEIGAEGGLPGWLAKKRAACDEATEAADPNLIFTAEPDKGHAHAIDRFVDEINGDAPVVCGIDDTVMATRVAFAAIKSAAENRIVKLTEI
ncbi:MAG: Gfo/Idh/MocA family oxidoreductase [Lentisphaeria bacterium]|nr:Gfo/Idh/MocA family oxidoreductase [Lentisphaeria bacterium]NQZ66478.1 Gfo/Idh/MocA family oxidoreductase [Lentisphaeria bacterium]